MFRMTNVFVSCCVLAFVGTLHADVTPAQDKPVDLSGAPAAVVPATDKAAPNDRAVRRRGNRGNDSDQQRAARMKRVDANGDGVIDKAERQSARERANKRRLSKRVIRKFDADGDGKLNKAERKAAHKAVRQRIMKQFDTDGDGKLSEAERQKLKEARQLRRAERRAADADGNRKLDKSERQTLRETRKARRGQSAAGSEASGGSLRQKKRQQRRNAAGSTASDTPSRRKPI